MAARVTDPSRPSTFQSLVCSFTSWRTTCVALQSFSSSSSRPLGLVLVAAPAWLKLEGFDSTIIAWVSTAQVPYAFTALFVLQSLFCPAANALMFTPEPTSSLRIQAR